MSVFTSTRPRLDQIRREMHLMEQPVRELRSTVLMSLVGPEILCRPVSDLELRAKRYPKAPLFVIDLRCAPTSGLDLAVNRFTRAGRKA
jgi:hypothetical protein